jgi:hypothetical protein
MHSQLPPAERAAVLRFGLLLLGLQSACPIRVPFEPSPHPTIAQPTLLLLGGARSKEIGVREQRVWEWDCAHRDRSIRSERIFVPAGDKKGRERVSERERPSRPERGGKRSREDDSIGRRALLCFDSSVGGFIFLIVSLFGQAGGGRAAAAVGGRHRSRDRRRRYQGVSSKPQWASAYIDISIIIRR